MKLNRRTPDDDTPVAEAADVVEKRGSNLLVRLLLGIIKLLLGVIRGLVATLLGTVGTVIGGAGTTVQRLTGAVRAVLVGTARAVSPLSHQRKADRAAAGAVEETAEAA